MKRPLISFIILTFLILLWPNSACTEPNEEKPIGPDTTSHEFEWRVDTIGTYGYLHDVAIIDDNNIWVVGEFYTPDPDSNYNGTGWERFNAAQWSNENWIYHKILGGVPLMTIWAFNQNDIWVSTGLPIHWDGSEWKLYHIQRMGVNASAEYSIWGTSSDNMYFGGGRGDLVHYDGDTFTKIELPNKNAIMDIWGVVDREGKETIYCVAEDLFAYSGFNIYKLDGRSQPKAVISFQEEESIRTLWFDEQSPFYIAGGSIYNKKTEELDWEKIDLPNKYFHKIRGNHSKDIFAVGNNMNIVHYNGVTWHSYSELPGRMGFPGMSFKNNTVAMNDWYNYVLIGIRKELEND